MQSEWRPHPEGMVTLLDILSSQSSTDNAVHRHAVQLLDEMNKVPDFPCYLVFLFVNNAASEIRSVAGLVLKNTVKRFNAFPEPVQLFVKGGILKCIGDGNHFIRETAANIVTTIVSNCGFELWPEIIPFLCDGLAQKEDPTLTDGSLFCVKVLCEDNSYMFVSEYLPHPPPLSNLIPLLLSFFDSHSTKWKQYAVESINFLIEVEPEALWVNIGTFLQGIFMLAMDQDPQIRRAVCEAFSRLLSCRIDLLFSHMPSIVEYMLMCLDDREDEVQIEAAEFFSALCQTQEADYVTETLTPHLPKLIPLLLTGMVFGEMELAMMKPEEEEHESIPDRPEEIKPYLHVQRGDDPDDDDGSETPTEYNLRRCSAACLDLVASVFEDREEFMVVLIPQIQSRLEPSQDWTVRECAILALGAIAGGCWKHLAPQLPTLMRYFVIQMSDQSTPYLIRTMCCWTISRYFPWVLSQCEADPEILRGTIVPILERISGDPNKRVQHTACSAFSVIEEEARNLLDPYLDIILHHILLALKKYQKKNLFTLYDSLGTLAESVGESLQVPEFKNQYMGALIEKWNTTTDDDVTLAPLLGCLTCIASSALGEMFVEYAAPVWGRCISLIQRAIMVDALPDGGKIVIDRKLLICALDLVSAIIESVASDPPAYVLESALPQLLMVVVKDPKSFVRQSAFALLGDLTKGIPSQVEPYLEFFIPVLLDNAVPDWYPVLSNALWVLGELAMNIPHRMMQSAAEVADRIVPLIKMIGELPVGPVENAAVALGRLGVLAPEIVSQRLSAVSPEWLVALGDVRLKSEREQAYRGLCTVIRTAPAAASPFFMDILHCFNQCKYPSQELLQNMTEIVHAYRQMVGEQAWAQLFGKLPTWSQNDLARKFGLY